MSRWSSFARLSRRMTTRVAGRQATMFALLTLVLATVLGTASTWRLHQEVHRVLAQQLPAQVDDTLVNSADLHARLALASAQLAAAQPPASLRTPLPLFDAVRITDLQITVGANSGGIDTLTWTTGDTTLTARWHLDSHRRLWPLLMAAFMLAGMLYAPVWGASRRPANGPATASETPPTDRAQPLAMTAGVPLETARRYLDEADLNDLDDTALAWFGTALRHGLEPAQAHAVAHHAPTLRFNLAAQQVVVHGLAITLSKTPLLYYYWYARRRANGLPDYVNPAANRPDRAEGESLADLMAAHDGHGKAIADLRAHGLRSKTLDQNRNKIRDELQQVLGELAAPYVFASQRDGATARYRHGLALPATHIEFSE